MSRKIVGRTVGTTLNPEKLKTQAGGGSGMSSTERSTLIAVVNAIGAFNVNNGQELIDAFMDAWVLKIPATGITLSAASLRFTAGISQSLTASVEPSDSTDTVVWSSSNPAVATVANGVVTPVANGDCVITATAGSVSATCTVNVAFAEEVVYYTITNNLTNCTSDNAAVSVVDGSAYTANLTASDGYTLDGASVSIVVNGEDITDIAYNNGTITIQNVVGNVVITVVAVEESAGGEVVMLKNISFDGTSYLDTEVIPVDVNYDYVIGFQYPEAYPATKNKENIGYWAGVSMRDSTSLTKANYMDMVFTTIASLNNYNADKPAMNIQLVFAGSTYALDPGKDKGDGLSTQMYDVPTYAHFSNANRSLWLDENLTVAPTTGHFSTISDATVMSEGNYYDANKMPIQSIWLGRPRVTSEVMQSQYKQIYAGVKFYCFKVYDSNENLIADMRPAKQGNTIGMWDNVRNKFYPATGTANYEEVPA